MPKSKTKGQELTKEEKAALRRPIGVYVRREVRTAIEEIAEKEQRKACKVAICAAFHGRKPGNDIACNILKSWRKEQLDKVVAKTRVSWPWGAVRCSGEVRLKRDILTRALGEEKLEVKIDTHRVSCKVERENEEPAEVTLELAPKVTFENGKATKAALNWGKVEGPKLVKGAIWTATATDNTFNVMQSTLIDDINAFIGTKCDEVKTEWAGK